MEMTLYFLENLTIILLDMVFTLKFLCISFFLTSQHPLLESEIFFPLLDGKIVK